MNEKTTKTLKYAVALSMPILVGYLFLGFAYGVLMQQQGLSVFWTFLMSAFVFAGTLQYAAIPLLISAFNPIATFILALGINARHLFYGLAIFDRYKKAKKTKFFLIFTMADEAFSINASAHFDDSIKPILFYNTVSLLSYLYWNTFTIMGHLFANSFEITIKGLGFVLPALFYTLFLTMWKVKEQRISMIVGLAVTLLSSLFVSDSLFIGVSMIGIVIIMGLVVQKEVNHE